MTSLSPGASKASQRECQLAQRKVNLKAFKPLLPRFGQIYLADAEKSTRETLRRERIHRGDRPRKEALGKPEDRGRRNALDEMLEDEPEERAQKGLEDKLADLGNKLRERPVSRPVGHDVLEEFWPSGLLKPLESRRKRRRREAMAKSLQSCPKPSARSEDGLKTLVSPPIPPLMSWMDRIMMTVAAGKKGAKSTNALQNNLRGNLSCDPWRARRSSWGQRLVSCEKMKRS